MRAEDVTEMAERVFNTHAMTPAVVAELVRLLPRLTEAKAVAMLEHVGNAYMLCALRAFEDGGQGFEFEGVARGDAALLLGADQLTCFVAVLAADLRGERGGLSAASRLELITAAALCAGRLSSNMAAALVVSIVNKNMASAAGCAE